MARTVHCIKLNKDAEGLDFPPVPGELGKRIWAEVSKEAWEDWKKLQTMMINEYGLNCADPKIRKHLMEQCASAVMPSFFRYSITEGCARPA